MPSSDNKYKNVTMPVPVAVHDEIRRRKLASGLSWHRWLKTQVPGLPKAGREEETK